MFLVSCFSPIFVGFLGVYRGNFFIGETFILIILTLSFSCPAASNIKNKEADCSPHGCHDWSIFDHTLVHS